MIEAEEGAWSSVEQAQLSVARMGSKFDGILTAPARVTEAWLCGSRIVGFAGADRLQHPVERQIAQGVAGHILIDLLNTMT